MDGHGGPLFDQAHGPMSWKDATCALHLGTWGGLLMFHIYMLYKLYKLYMGVVIYGCV